MASDLPANIYESVTAGLINSIYKIAMTGRATGSANWPESEEVQEAARTPPEDLWCISLYEVKTNDYQQRMVRRTNTIYSRQ